MDDQKAEEEEEELKVQEQEQEIEALFGKIYNMRIQNLLIYVSGRKYMPKITKAKQPKK